MTTAERIKASRAEQGLPPFVVDQLAICRIVTLIESDEASWPGRWDERR